jgi:TetR/AcrR family transcriptional regulator
MGVTERREKEREQRRSAIIDAAKRVFMEMGLEQASMDRIATESELAKGTLYLYFKSKNELIMAIMTEHLQQLNARLLDVARSRLSPQNKVLKSVDVFFAYSSEHQIFYQIMTAVNVREMCQCTPDQQSSPDVERFRELNRETMVIVHSILEDGIAKGAFDPSLNVASTVPLMMVALKGAMVVIMNGMYPPDMFVPPVNEAMGALAKMFVRSIERRP